MKGQHVALKNSLPEVPPVSIVLLFWDTTTENTPSPLVDEVTKRQEGDLLQGHLQQVIQIRL